ncbi:nifu-like protein [Cichlidogyrus casuarinus]|uniref:Nifu-like protein n=1 Tax=Cichlidogyrus casuarinus TaxID=1844966 RepID=A0ABD2QPT5_9PLAT
MFFPIRSPSGLLKSVCLLRRLEPSFMQLRKIFIQTQETPNPNSIKCFPGKTVLDDGTYDFPTRTDAKNSPLAKVLFNVKGVERVFFGNDYISITKEDNADWSVLKPELFATMMDFFTSGLPIITATPQAANSSSNSA